jgi:hypothetical protein
MVWVWVQDKKVGEYMSDSGSGVENVKNWSPVERVKNWVARRRSRDDGPRYELPNYSTHQISWINEQVGRRRELIESLGLSNEYAGEFLNMQVFEGPIVIRDYRSGHEQLKEINVRMIVAGNMDFPAGKTALHGGYSDVNDTTFASMFFKVVAKNFESRVVVDSAKKDPSDINRGLVALIDQYEKNEQDGVDYPLTVVYAHGVVDYYGQHQIQSGILGDYPTDFVLDEILETYPPPDGVKKIPVLLTSCNETNKKSAKISHSKMALVYREGKPRLIGSTGKIVVSR